MRSIKPGRGPSAMSGIGSIGVAIFGIIWMISALSMGAPPLFALFGVVFVVLAIVQAVYHLKNASSGNRYSSFDITDEHEEPDPLNKRFDSQRGEEPEYRRREHGREVAGFCPYCGAAVEEDYAFCRKCGRGL